MQLYEMTDIEPRYYGKDYVLRLGFELFLVQAA
jgi:hypothetical protein